MFSKRVYKVVCGLSAVLCTSAFALPSLAEEQTWYGYCWVEKENRHICKTPELRDDDFNNKCRDFAIEIHGARWGARFSTDVAALESDMGSHCDEIWQQQGELYACNLEVTCPAGSNEPGGMQNLGNRIYAAGTEKAVDRCSDTNAHRIVAAVKRYSKLDCSVKLVAQVIE